MIQKKHKYNHSASGKLTFKTYSPLCLLINELTQLKPQLQKLLNVAVLRHCDLEQIVQILQDFPKTFQRNISLINEISVFQHLAEIIKNLVQPKKQRKYKPYHLYTNWKIGQEILIKRIREGIKGNLEQLTNNPKNLIIYNFIRQIELVSASIQRWANFKTSKNVSQIQPNITFFYPQTPWACKKTSPTTRQTAVSSACISRDNSHQQKNLIESSKDFQYKKKTLQRSSTAKTYRQQLKFNTRCPSANQLLAQCFKKPIFEAKKSIKRTAVKNADFQASKSKKLNKSSSNLKCSKHIQEIQELINNECNANTRNISILDKTFQNIQIEAATQLKEQTLEKEQDVHSSLNFINHEDNNENDEDLQQVTKQPSVVHHNEDIKAKEVVRTQQRKKTGIHSKRRENSSALITGSKRSSIQSVQKLSKHEIKINKGKANYRGVRKSGKLSFKSIDSIKNENYQVPPNNKSGNFAKRRKAMLSEKKMSEVLKIVEESKKEAEEKKLQFEENVLLALADAIQIQKNNQHKQEQEKPQNQLAFQYRYTQLKRFVNSTQFNRQFAHISAFFEQQQKIKRAQDIIMKQKIKVLMKKQTFSNIFEISCSTKNNKDTIYNQIERRFSFISDQQWIKQAFDGKSSLQQKSL